MDPLVVAGCVGKPVNLLLGDLVPVANANLGANRGLEILEVVKDAHLSDSFSVQPLAQTPVDDPLNGLHNCHGPGWPAELYSLSRVLGSQLFKSHGFAAL